MANDCNQQVLNTDGVFVLYWNVSLCHNITANIYLLTNCQNKKQIKNLIQI